MMQTLSNKSNIKLYNGTMFIDVDRRTLYKGVKFH